MDQSRRTFVKNIAVAGSVAAIGNMMTGNSENVEKGENVPKNKDRCPYFDQPMYCKGVSKTGKPLCE